MVSHPTSPSFLWKEVARSAGGWLSSFRLRPTPCPSGIPLPSEGGRWFFTTSPLLPLEGGGAQRRRLASLSFAFGQPPALRASPFHGKGVDRLLIPLLPPSSGRRWRVAPEVGFALFHLRPTPALRASPFHGKGVDAFHPASPSFLWKEVARSAGGWLSSFRLRPTPCPSGIPLP